MNSRRFLGASALLLALAAGQLCFGAREISLRAFGFETSITDLLVAQGRSSYQPITMGPFELGAPVSVTIPGDEVVLYRSQTDAQGVEQKRRVAAFTARPGVSDYVIGVMPLPPAQTADPAADLFRVMAFPADTDSFPPGHVRVINMSPFPVAAKVGEQNLTFPAGATRDVKLQNAESASATRVFSQFAVQTGPEWHVFHRGPMGLRERWRGTWLIAYSSAVLSARGEEGPRQRNGRLAPQMVIVKWHDYVRPPQAPTGG